VFALACILATAALAATRAYFVEPKAATSAWSAYQGWVGQSFVANVDSIYYLEWFVGDLSSPGRYKFDIIEKSTSQLVCWGSETVPGRGWQWLRCSNFTGDLQFTKGKEYLLKVSHDAGDSEI
jgi:hypothetical protein